MSIFLVSPSSISLSGPTMVTEHGPFQLVCEVSANPAPEVVWLKLSGGKVTTILDTSTRTSISGPYSSMEAIYSSTLTVNKAVPSDRGEYVCEASNSGMPNRTIGATSMLQISGYFLVEKICVCCGILMFIYMYRLKLLELDDLQHYHKTALDSASNQLTLPSTI